MHIPTCTGLLTVNVNLLYVSQINQPSNIFLTFSLVLMTILDGLFRCLKVFTSNQFLKFSIFTIYCIVFLSLSLFFLQLLFLCVLNSTYAFSYCGWLNSNTRCSFLVLILVSNTAKVIIMKHILFFIKKSHAPIL